MRFKLEENLPVSSARSLTKSGHDVDTVAAEALTGAADPDVVAAAAAEERVLITLDRGLATSAPTCERIGMRDSKGKAGPKLISPPRGVGSVSGGDKGHPVGEPYPPPNKVIAAGRYGSVRR